MDLIYEMVQLAIADGMNPHYKYFLESFVGTEMDNAVEICAAVLNYPHADADYKVILNLSTAVENCMPNQLDDLLRRIRFYQAAMDRRALESGKDCRELPDSFIIFVCKFDYFGGGLAVYRRKTVLEGREDIPYEDGSHVYILNSAYKEGNTDPAILEYLRCIRENDVDYGYESELMRAVCPAIKSVRSDEQKEVSYMTMQMLMADERWAGREGGLKEGLQQGLQLGARRIVVRMFRKGKPVEDIAEDTDTPIDEVRNILKAEGLLD